MLSRASSNASNSASPITGPGSGSAKPRAPLRRRVGTAESDRSLRSSARRVVDAPTGRGSGALQLLVALAPVAAALLDPAQAAGGVVGLVDLPLVRAGVEPGLASALSLAYFASTAEGNTAGPAGAVGFAAASLSFLAAGLASDLVSAAFASSAFGAAVVAAGVAAASAPHSALRKSFQLLAGQASGRFRCLIFRAAFLRGQRLRRRCGRQRQAEHGAEHGGACDQSRTIRHLVLPVTTTNASILACAIAVTTRRRRYSLIQRKIRGARIAPVFCRICRRDGDLP